MTDEVIDDGAKPKRNIIWTDDATEPPFIVGRAGAPIRITATPEEQRKGFTMPDEEASFLINHHDAYKRYREDKGKKT